MRSILSWLALLLLLATVFAPAQVDAYQECYVPPGSFDQPGSPDCHGGTCILITSVANYTYCSLCPAGQTGLHCEIPSGIVYGNCPGGCGQYGRCLMTPGNGPAVCVDCPVGKTGPGCAVNLTDTLTSYLPSRALAQFHYGSYGPFVCGVTAPCDWKSFAGPYIPRGTCGVDYTLNMFDGTRSACGPTGGDYCAVGPFFNNRVQQLPKPKLQVECSKLDTYMQEARWTQFISVEMERAYGIGYITGPGPLCDNFVDKCSSGTCVRQTGDSHVVGVDGFWRTVPAQDICCRLGHSGNYCELFVGCLAGGCINGGTCLTHDKAGQALRPEDTRCFGCTPGVNGTLGWTGARCEIPVTPTFSLVNATAPGRRLLQTGDVYVRTWQGYTSPYQGVIYKEPARVCDCGVRWESPDRNFTGLQWMWMGNFPSNTTASVLVSTVQYDPVASKGVSPFYWQTVRTLAQAQYLCSRYYPCEGVAYDDVAKQFAAIIGINRTWNGVVQTGGPPATGLSQSTQRYVITRLVDPARCPNGTTLDPVFYCATYKLQCQKLREQGGVGNIRVDSTTPVDMVASLHFDAFGHLVRNKPNAACDLTVDYAEDETGCVNLLRSPKAYYALAPGETLTAEICGNSSRINDSRVALGPLAQGVTGTNITNGMDAVCQCYPPFRAADTNMYQDCAYDLCGIVDGRGLVNATYANALDHASHFNHTDPRACVCNYPWGTDPASCANGYACDWCSATACLNGGTVTGGNYTAACACNSIFAGDLCEVSLCNATNSYPFNYSQWVLTGQTAEEIACDCKPGWTGHLCSHPQCIFGQFNYETETCECAEGYQSSATSGGTCDEPKCDLDKGFWTTAHYASQLVPMSANSTYTIGNTTFVNDTQWSEYATVLVPAQCVCQPPWTGERCREHKCDDYNVVLEIAGWAGKRPFGQPQIVGNNNATWECGCNWPYKPIRTGTDRAYECSDHDCNFGTPNADASLVHAATDACTCTTEATTGVFTDPIKCTGFSHNECPNACRVGTCGLSFANITAFGSVQLGDTPDCCRCDATVGYNINGQCQPFCAFYQPCLTTPLSGFVPNPDYNATIEYQWANANVTRIPSGNDEWICACRAGCVNTDDTLNDCANCTYHARDAGLMDVPVDYGLQPPAPDGANILPPELLPATSTSASILQNKAAVIAIGIAGGLVALAIAVAIAQQVAASSVASATVAAGTDQAPLVQTKGKIRRSSARVLSRIMLVFIVCIVQCTMSCAQGSLPFVYPATAHWDRWYATGSSIADVRISMTTTEMHPPPSGGSSNLQCSNQWDFHPFPDSLGSMFNGDWELTFENAVGRVSHLLPYHIRGKHTGDGFSGEFTLVPPGGSPAAAKRWSHTYSTAATPVIGDQSFWAPYSVEFTILAEETGDTTYTNPSATAVLLTAIDTFPDFDEFAYAIECSNQPQCFRTSTTGWQLAYGTGTPVIRWLDTPNGVLATASQNINTGSGDCSFKGTVYTPFNTNTRSGTAYLDIYRHGGLYVRGMQCNNGLYGVKCENTCPAASVYGTGWSPLCSGNGKCDTTATAITVQETDGIHYCRCPVTCVCAAGYVGVACEQAVFTAVAPLTPETPGETLTDFSECCPADHTNCAPVRSRRTFEQRAPTTRCTNWKGYCIPGAGEVAEIVVANAQDDSVPLPWTESLRMNQSVNHAYSPYRCGEDVNAAVVGWTPTVGFNAGHGRCDVFTHAESSYLWDGTPMPQGKGFCWCNNPATARNANARHGWFGPGCATRTCTQRNNVLTLDSTGQQVYIDIGSATQCGGNSVPAYSSTSANYGDAALTPCEDLTVAANGNIYNINTPGYCKQCQDGWGLHVGYHPLLLARYGYTDPLSGVGHNGLCNRKTLYSRSGGMCGGYGKATWTNVQAKAADGTSIGYVNYVTSCTCPLEWGLTTPPGNGGLCQRTCAGDPNAPLVVMDFSVRPTIDALGNFNGTTDVTVTYNMTAVRCGGYTHGMCRPIMLDERGGGFNSACMCNPGYNGPQCDKIESAWYKGAVCGPDGEAVLTPRGSPYLGAGSDDEDWFVRYIVPMNSQAALMSQTDYSAYKCQCKKPARDRYWEVNANGICVRGCNSTELKGSNGLTCSGHGRCVDNPVVGGDLGKVCSCDLGWDGTNCGRQNLRDQIGQVCGGVMDGEGEDHSTPRGKIVYQDGTNLTQKCACNAPYIPNALLGPSNALCWRNCSNSCTDPAHGTCIQDPITGNDNVCNCTAGAFWGADCSRQLVAVYLTQSGSELACTGHGIPDPKATGKCICDVDYVGEACEIYATNRFCDWGQTFLDTESTGIIVR